MKVDSIQMLQDSVPSTFDSLLWFISIEVVQEERIFPIQEARQEWSIETLNYNSARYISVIIVHMKSRESVLQEVWPVSW